MKKPEVVMINNSTAAIPWLAKSRPDPRARVRLFCFPYAGGELVRAAVNDRDVPTKRDAAGRPWALHYYALPEEGVGADPHCEVREPVRRARQRPELRPALRLTNQAEAGRHDAVAV